MRNANAYRSAGIAGFVLLAMPVLDVATGGATAGPMHAVVGIFALVLIAISGAPADSKSTHSLSEVAMNKHHEMILSASDVEVLALMLGERRRLHTLEASAADALTDLLVEARRVPHEELPPDRIAMNSRVAYREEPEGMRRTVVLVHPIEADAAAGRISVLSPVGLALLGRRSGAVVTAIVPGGHALRLRILESSRNRELRAA